MSLGGTLIVAVVGGAVGSGLAILGGLISQTRQHRFEHNEWTGERMEAAAARFGEAASTARRLLNQAAWAFDDDREELEHGCVRQADEVSNAIVGMNLAFGSSAAAAVTESAYQVESAIRHCITLLNDLDGVPPTAEVAVPPPVEQVGREFLKSREEFLEGLQALDGDMIRFTLGAASVVFYAPPHKSATRRLWKRLRQPR
jgi:hypothetical protein